MVEQPFPVRVPGADSEREAWVNVRRAYNDVGILIFADESCGTIRDLPALEGALARRANGRGNVRLSRCLPAGLCDGVNVKLEKAGGLRVRTARGVCERVD